MAGNSNLNIQLVISALDYATKDIEHVNQKVKELGATLNASEYTLAAGTMERFGQAVEDATDPTAQLTARNLALAASMTAVASALAGKVYQSAVEYESALADLAKVSEGGTEEAQRYGAALDQLALKYAANGQELLSAMTNFKQAGFDSSEAFALVEDSLKLMIAGELEAGEASQNLVSILKGFDAPAGAAAHAVDLLNEVSNKYATNVQELSVGMAAISPIAKQMGFSMDETAGLLTPIIEVFQSGNEAADALKTGLQKLTDDAAPVRAALESIGVSQTNANGSLRTGREIFLDVARAMQGMDDAQRQVVTSQLVGIDQAGRMSVVFGNLSKTLAVTATASGATGSAANEVAVRLATSEAAAKRADESFRQLSTTLGNTIKPELTGVISATGTLAAAFDNAVKAGDLNPLLNAIRPQIAAVESLFNGLAANLETALQGLDWTPLVNGLKDISGEFGEAFSALFDGVDPTTAQGLQNLLQGLVNLLGKFSTYIAGVLDGLEPFLDTLNLLFTTFSNGSTELSRFIGELHGLMTSANLVIPAIADVASTVFGAIGAVADFAFKVGLAITAFKLLSAAGLPVAAMFSGLTSAIGALLPTVLAAVGRFTGLTAALKLTAAAAVLVGSYKIGEALREWGVEAGYAAEQGTLAAKAFDLLATEAEKAELHLREVSERGSAHLTEISERTGVAVATMREFNRAVEDGKLVFDETAGLWVAATAKVEDYTDANRRMIEESDRQLSVAEALRAEFERLGLTYDATTGKIDGSAAALAAMRDELKAATAEYERLIAAGDAQGAAQMLQRIQTLEAEIKRLGQSAGVSAKEVEKAFKDLGVTSQDELGKLAENAKAAFETIKTSGTAAPEDIANAFTAYATAAIAANNGVADASLRAQAAQLGLQVQTGETGDQVVQTNTGVTQSNQQVSDSAGEVTTSLAGVGEQAGETGDQLGQLTDAADSAGGAALAMKKILDGVISNLSEVSQEAAGAVQGIIDSLASWNEKIAQIRDLQASDFIDIGSVGTLKGELAELESAAKSTQATADELAGSWNKAFDVFGKFYEGIGAIKQLEADVLKAQAAVVRTEIAIEQMGQAFDSLTDSYDRGDLSLSQYIDKLEQMRWQYGRLSDEDLSALTDALADAKAEQQDLVDTALSGLNSWKAKLYEIKGQEIELQKLNWAEDKLETELALADARRNGNTEEIAALQEQLKLINEYYQIKIKDAEASEAAAAADAAAERERHTQTIDNLNAESEARQRASETNATTQTTTPSTTAPVTPVRTVNVNISTPSGVSGSVRVLEGDEDTLERLLKSLEAGQRVYQ